MAPDPDAVLGHAAQPRSKALLLIVLGQKYPPLRERFFALARQLNYDTAPPYLTIKRLAGE
jgi:hypothetical protein